MMSSESSTTASDYIAREEDCNPEAQVDMPSTDDDKYGTNMNCWFLSISCIDDIAHSFASDRPSNSAFSTYQRPTHVISLFDASFDEVEERDDVIDNDDDYWPSIERTFSFDEWDDEDHLNSSSINPTSSFVFSEAGHAMNESDDRTQESVITVPFNKQEISNGRTNSCFLEKQTSSLQGIIPQSDSFMFRPIGGNNSRLSLNTSGDSTASIFSDLSPPKCPGIRRLSTNIEDCAACHHPTILHVEIEHDGDAPSPCLSSPTVYHPPIPSEIVFKNESKGLRKKILKSWMKVVRRRSANGTDKGVVTSPLFKGRKSNQMRRRMGEF